MATSLGLIIAQLFLLAFFFVDIGVCLWYVFRRKMVYVRLPIRAYLVLMLNGLVLAYFAGGFSTIFP